MLNATSSEYQDYVVFVDSKALRGRSNQNRAAGEHYAGRDLQGIGEREVFERVGGAERAAHGALGKRHLLTVTVPAELRGAFLRYPQTRNPFWHGADP